MTPPVVSTGAIRRVNTTAADLAGDQESGSATLSNDATMVAFYSKSTDLVPGAGNGQAHVYVKNLVDGSLRLVDRAPSGAVADDSGSSPFTVNAGLSFSPDGQWLAFCSPATNLVAGAPLDGYGDLYRVNLASGAVGWLAPGCRGPRYSPDGAKIAWTTSYPLLPTFDTDFGDPDVYAGFVPAAIGDWITTAAMVSSNAAGLGPDAPGTDSADNAAWSPDSTRVAFTAGISNLVPNDTNIAGDIFVKTMGADLNSDGIERVSTTSTGGQANAGSSHPTWSPDGTRVAFSSDAGNLSAADVNVWPDIFVKNLASGAVDLISVDDKGESSFQRNKQPRWSPDGTRIAYTAAFVDYNGFDSRSQVFVKNLVTGWRQLVSATGNGVEGNSSSTLWDTGNIWSPDSTRLIFQSNATNFVTDNNAWHQDVFEKTVG